MLDLGGTLDASLYAISKCKLQSVVVVEPDIDNFKLLQLNTRPYSNIQCINAAVWTHKTSVSLLEQRGGEWGSIFVEETKPSLTNNIVTYTPHELISHINDKSNMFIKIDIEGSEKQLFLDPSASTWVSNAKLISCELHDRIVPGCSEAFYAVMQKLSHMVEHKNGEYTYFTTT